MYLISRTVLKNFCKKIFFPVTSRPFSTIPPIVFRSNNHFGIPSFQRRFIGNENIDGNQGPSQASFGARSDQLDSPLPPASTNTLYVGNLFFEVAEAALEQEFSRFGAIRKTRIVYDYRGLSKGFGYVEFENDADAGKAVDELNQQVFHGRRITVQFHQPKNIQRQSFTKPEQPTGPTKTLFIGNMSFEMSDKDLNALFREIEDVSDVRVAIDRRTGQPRGFAHADFKSIEGATKAKEILETKELYGRKLRIDFSNTTGAKARQERPEPPEPSMGGAN